MKDFEKTKSQLIHEIAELRMRCATLEIKASESKQLEAEIQDAREYAENIVETVREPLVVLNSDLKILTANHSFYDTFKVTPEDTIGNFIYDLGNRQWDIPKLRVLVEEILPHDTVINGYEVEHDFQGIGRKVILLNARQIFREKIGSHIILLAMEDITARKLDEKVLLEKNIELERFTYTVSHDLKSPLVTIKTFLGYLEEDLRLPDKSRVQQDLGYIHNAADKMTQLLAELLELLRVGRLNNLPQEVSFRDLAREAVQLDAGRISARGVTVEISDLPVALLGDRPRLVEIWQNLVENSCKFMGNQENPCIEVGVEHRGQETVFFVRDNGIGINPSFHSKVFGLFEKLDVGGEGTGLGLALVKRIVEMYDGTIRVESAGEGEGTAFFFTLPAAMKK